MILSIKHCVRPALVLAFCCLAGCGFDDRPVTMGGAVFGTSWSLTYSDAGDAVDPAAVRAEIESVFELVNSSMNHYQSTSLISRFNTLPANTPVEVDWDFAYVLSTALTLSEVTGGAYDVTVSALSELWGFGQRVPRVSPHHQPSQMRCARWALSSCLGNLKCGCSRKRCRGWRWISHP